MNKKFLNTLTISLLITVIFFLSQAFPLVKHFGISSIVEEKSLELEGESKPDFPILKGNKISARFKPTDNNLGVVLIRFIKFGKGQDTLVFRIKKEGDQEWYYENKYFGELFKHNQYYPFGLPAIPGSKDNSYIIEIESLSGQSQNGVAVSQREPRTGFVYSLQLGELKTHQSLLNFIYKKNLYVLTNIDYPRLGFIFIFSFILAKFWKSVKKNPRKVLLNYVKSIKSFYVTSEGKVARFFKQTEGRDTKKRIAIAFLIFLLAFIYRFSSSLVSYEGLFYYQLGGQGDYDQFIRASTCALNLCSLIVHQNLLVESTILGTFYEMLGFIGGIKTYLYLMFITSSIVATLPYLLLSRRNWITLGGIIGSLFLATSDFLTQVALSFPPDNLSLFTFSIFFIVYFFTLQMGTIRWLLFFGLVGLVDGMTKALFLINDLAALALFVPAFFYEKTRKTALPIAKQLRVILKRKNIKILLLALLPLLIFLILYSAWEYFVQIKFTAPYFLRLLVETGGSNFRFETLFYNRSSGGAEQDLILQLFYLLISGLVMIKRITNISDLQVIFLAPIFFGLLLFSFIKSRFKIKLSPVKLGTILVLSVVNIASLVSIKNNYLGIHQVFPGEYIYANWTLETYVSVFLFASIIFLFILNFKYQAFKLALPIIPYVIMLIILTKNAPWERLLAHVIVWSIILLSFLIDWILSNAKENNALKRLWIGSIILVLFISFYTIPKTANMVGKLWEGINIARSEVKYLKWVNSELPENSIVLAGGKSDLIAVGENINRPMVYNSLWSTSLLIRPNRIPGISPQDFTLIGELGNKENFNNKRYFVLEDDIDLWKGRLQGVGDSVFTTDPKSNIALHAEDFSIKLYKTNQELNKNIYELGPKE